MVGAIAVQTTQAAGMSAMSNIIAQYFAAYQAQVRCPFNFWSSRTNYKIKAPFSLELGALARYVLYGVLNTPLNCLWQEYLERKFPARDADQPAKGNKQQAHRGSNLKNLAVKFGLDQTVGAAGNILFFIVVQGILNGTPVSEIRQAILRVGRRLHQLAAQNFINRGDFRTLSVYI